jgi:hypothetical protein
MGNLLKGDCYLRTPAYKWSIYAISAYTSQD